MEKAKENPALAGMPGAGSANTPAGGKIYIFL